MKLVIDNKPYELKYSFEASLYDDCVDQMFNYLGDSTDGALRQKSGTIFKVLSGTPNLVITLFYAGLMEKNPVESREAAKELLKKYFYENKGKPDANFGGMFREISNQMEQDHFLDLIGLTSAMEELEKTMKEQQAKKIPTDHLKEKASKK